VSREHPSSSVGGELAAVDYFLKIAGIDGESTDNAHKGEIDIESWAWGESHSRGSATGVGGGVGAGKVTMDDFSFVMKLSKASPKLFLACAQGEHIKSAWLTAHRAGGKQTDYFLKWSFADLRVSSYQTGGSENVNSTDQVSFNFSKIEIEYKEQKPDGTLSPSIKAGWDLKTNKKI
jgi:type VI secretion system secreted protein Hcp